LPALDWKTLTHVVPSVSSGTVVVTEMPWFFRNCRTVGLGSVPPAPARTKPDPDGVLPMVDIDASTAIEWSGAPHSVLSPWPGMTPSRTERSRNSEGLNDPPARRVSKKRQPPSKAMNSMLA